MAKKKQKPIVEAIAIFLFLIGSVLYFNDYKDYAVYLILFGLVISIFKEEIYSIL